LLDIAIDIDIDSLYNCIVRYTLTKLEVGKNCQVCHAVAVLVDMAGISRGKVY